MRLHPREALVTEARLDLTRRILDWREQHDDLTFGELLSILGGTLSSQITSLVKYEIRGADKEGGPMTADTGRWSVEVASVARCQVNTCQWNKSEASFKDCQSHVQQTGHLVHLTETIVTEFFLLESPVVGS